MRPLVVAIPRFIQIRMPLPPLKSLGIASTRGCTCASSIRGDGSIKAWGSSGHGGTDASSGSGYTKIYSNKNR
jgi:hypothetical protein